MNLLKICTKCGIDKQLTDFYKNSELLDGHYNDCKSCRKERTRKHRASNPEEIQKRSRDRYAKNPEKFRKQKRESAKRNIGKIIARNRAYNLSKQCAVPSWVKNCFGAKIIIANMYKKARELTLSTGIKHHVDHIIPIKGDYVCGLHVPLNLQILTAEENIRKRNNWPISNDSIP